MNEFCSSKNLDVAGVIKFSDGNIDIARAYHEGGCRQLASSRTVHLEKIKKEIPEAVTMLIRIPMISECSEVVKWCDISLNSQEKVLRELNRCAREIGKIHSVLLMMDVGDRREGVVGIERLMELTLLSTMYLKYNLLSFSFSPPFIYAVLFQTYTAIYGGIMLNAVPLPVEPVVPDTE